MRRGTAHPCTCFRFLVRSFKETERAKGRRYLHGAAGEDVSVFAYVRLRMYVCVRNACPSGAFIHMLSDGA